MGQDGQLCYRGYQEKQNQETALHIPGTYVKNISAKLSISLKKNLKVLNTLRKTRRKRLVKEAISGSLFKA